MLKRFILILLTLRIFFSLLACFLPITYPHLWRQTDTMGVSLRYFLRFYNENFAWENFLPAVLNSGTQSGIMPMEFPVLNFICAPFFYLGPAWGKVSASIFVVILTSVLLFINAKLWEKIFIFNTNLSNAMLLMPIFSFCVPLTWVFMPDMISVLLCYISLALIWNQQGKSLILSANFIATIGLLMKPTSISVFAFLLLKFFEKSEKLVAKQKYNNVFKTILIKFCIFIPAFAITGYYYLIINKQISAMGSKGLFAVNIRPSFQMLVDYFKSFAEVYDIMDYHLFFPYGLSLFIITILLCLIQKRQIFAILSIFIVGLFQCLIIVVLSGKHSLTHYYYYMGSSATFAFCAIKLFNFNKPNINLIKFSNIKLYFFNNKLNFFYRFAIFTFIGLFIASQFEIFYRQIKGYFNNYGKSSETPIWDCNKIINRNQNIPWKTQEVFVTNYEIYPALGLCFGVRTNAKHGTYGLFYSDAVPINWEIIDREGKIVLAKNLNNSKTQK